MVTCYNQWLQSLKVALEILERKLNKNTKKSPLYSQSILIFIHKTPVVENHSTAREIRELLGRQRRESRSIFTREARTFTSWKYTGCK